MTKFRQPRSIAQRGSALISIIIVVPFLILLVSLFMELAISSVKVARKDQGQTMAQFSVDAGLDYALQKINSDSTWTNSGEVELQYENGIRTTFEVSLTVNSPTSRTLTSTGRTYQPALSADPIVTRTIKADLRPVQSGSYSIVTGVGGLFMSNSAKIVGGDVLVNGEISMSNTAQIGLSTNPVKVEVAHQNCPVPADTTYPRLCASGENGQPITIANSAHIYGTVKANNQTNGAGMTNPGLTAGSVAASALPTHDRAAQKAAAVNNLTGAAASCTTNGGTKSWPANVKITGNVIIEKTCKVTLNGNAWITGTLTMSNSGQIIVSNALGATMPDVMVDGTSTKLSNSSALVSNSTGTGLRLISYWSRAACSPDCTDVTGADLYNSRNDETISLDNSASAPESIFYARWTRVALKNSGGIGALIGQTVHLSNTATVTFGSSVSIGGATYWVLNGYYRSFQ